MDGGKEQTSSIPFINWESLPNELSLNFPATEQNRTPETMACEQQEPSTRNVRPLEFAWTL